MRHAAETSAPRLRPRADVQGLRALAVLLVVLDHAGVPWLQGGFVGVDVFFVVSGFLISSLLLHELVTDGRLRIGRFYARRARRILPAATLVLVATSVVAAIELPVTRLGEIVQDVRWAGFFAANVHFSRLGTDYFEQDRALSPVQHFWSLAVEEQFYLFWPALLAVVALVAARRRLTVVTGLVSVTWLASFAWSVVATHHSPTASYFSSFTRGWELATGGLLALAGALLLRVPRRAAHVLSVLGLGAITAAAVWYDGSTPFPGWPALLPVLGTAALLSAGAAGAVGAGRVLTSAPLRYVGRSWSASETTVLLGVVLLLSMLSYHLVENPIRRSRGWTLRGRRALVLWPVALASVLLGSGWAEAHATQAFRARVAGSAAAGQAAARQPADTRHGVPVRSVPVSRRLDDALRLTDSGAPIPFPLQNLARLDKDVWQHRVTCYASWKDVKHEICPVGQRDAGRTVVVFGNSHAGMWTPALDTLGRRDGYRVIPFVKLGCAPFDVKQLDHGAPYPQCPAFRRWATHEIAGLHPDVVVLAFGGRFGVRRDSHDAIKPEWPHGIASAVRRVQRLAPDVKVMSDITNLKFSPGDCITDPDSTRASCLTREEEVTGVGNALTRGITERLGADYVDVTGLVCLRHRCPLVVDRIVTYHDDAHLSVTWTEAVTDDLGRRLALFRS